MGFMTRGEEKPSLSWRISRPLVWPTLPPDQGRLSVRWFGLWLGGLVVLVPIGWIAGKYGASAIALGSNGLAVAVGVGIAWTALALWLLGPSEDDRAPWSPGLNRERWITDEEAQRDDSESA
jgi:hypothetical protein